MTILVTGSDGLVGSALRQVMSGNIYFATRDDGDLTSLDEATALFKKIQPDQVIHLAALVGGIGGNLMHSGDYFRDNLLINTNVLEISRKSGVSRLISFMSTCVFPNDGPYPLHPSNIHLGQPHPSNFGYAYAKRMLEVQSRAYRTQWGLDYFVAIPTNIYGPCDNFDLNEGHVVPALIHKAYLAKKLNKSVEVWGTGTPLREFVYSVDVAKLIVWLMQNYCGEDPIILSSGVENSISELAQTIVKKFRIEENLKFDLTKLDGQFRKPSDTSALKALLPDFQFTSLQTGISETINWFMDNYPKVRM
jgi:GDP-L-fucose synthase